MCTLKGTVINTASGAPPEEARARVDVPRAEGYPLLWPPFIHMGTLLLFLPQHRLPVFAELDADTCRELSM